MDDIRPIAVLPQIMNVLEKAIKNKLEAFGSKLLSVGQYQTGFKKGLSTRNNLTDVLNEIMRTRTKRRQRKIYIAVDFSKAYDSIIGNNSLSSWRLESAHRKKDRSLT